MSLSDDIQKFKIEGMSIGDSALEYFSELQLEDNEQGWHNYNYKEYSTSLLPGKGIYDWFLVSYNNNDEKFIIVDLVGGLAKKNYKKTEGCIAIKKIELLKIIKEIKINTKVKIEHQR